MSYSKSLAVCLLKYNDKRTGELHILDEDYNIDTIYYTNSKRGIVKAKWYNIEERSLDNPIFKKNTDIYLEDFMIDISIERRILDKYIEKYTNKSTKKMISPQKDQEVIVMNPRNDLVVPERSMDSIYVLYALQKRYHFLKDKKIRKDLKHKIKENVQKEEREVFYKLISYLGEEWKKEEQNSKKIYDYEQRITHWLKGDPFLEFDSISREEFEYAYNHRVYEEKSQLFWDSCAEYLGCPVKAIKLE